MFRNGLQPSHIIILVLVIILIFGASKLPDIASNIGKSMKVFKKEVKELREDDDVDTSSYTATGGQPPQQTSYPPYPGAQNPPAQQPGQGQYQPPVQPPVPGQGQPPVPGQGQPPVPGQGQSPDQPGHPRADGTGHVPQS